MPPVVAAVGAVGALSATGGAAVGAGIAGTTFTAANVLAGAAMIGTVASTGMQVYGQRQAEKQADRIAQHNLAVEAANREQMKAEGREELDRQRQRNKRFLAQQRGAQAASGLQMDTGTSLAMEAENAAMLELGALDTQYKMNMGLRQSQSRSAEIEMESRARRKASGFNTASTLIGGATQMARLKI